MPTPSPVKGGKLPKKALPKARVKKLFHPHGGLSIVNCAVVYTATKAQAARICRVANMTVIERRKLVSEIIYHEISSRPNELICFSAGDATRAVLNALGLGGEATR